MSRVLKPRKRPRVGDVVLIATTDGAAFAQYIHRHPDFGDLVRVTGPAVSTADPTRIAAGPTQFTTFFPLGAACRRGIAQILGPAPIPPECEQFPRFRQPLRLDPRSRAPCNWLIWDGREEWTVPALSEEQRLYPLREIVNDTLLVERALKGWRSEHEQ